MPSPGSRSTARLPANGGDPRERSGSVTLTTSRKELNEDISRRWAVVAGLALLAGLIAVAVGIRTGRRLALPLEDLARQASRIGAGNVRPGGRRYGINEVDRVAEALDSSMLRIAALLERERAFAADASHQLRTPLAALALRLEEIASSDDPGEMRAEAVAGLDQVERLTAVVDGFLAEVRRQRSGSAVPVDVGAVLAAQRREWEPLFQRAGRSLATKFVGPAGERAGYSRGARAGCRHAAGERAAARRRHRDDGCRDRRRGRHVDCFRRRRGGPPGPGAGNLRTPR